MKLKINDIEREVQIVQAPQGAFCCLDELALPSFPLFVGLCKAITDKETPYGEVLVCPIFDNNEGYASINVDEVKNELYVSDLKKLIRNYSVNFEYDSLKEIVESIMYDFNIHKTPITIGARKFIEKVMDGTITDIPTAD